ncbi:MAG: hypothetical protein AAF926_07875 [Pseudomonadota bacterium]
MDSIDVFLALVKSRREISIALTGDEYSVSKARLFTLFVLYEQGHPATRRVVQEAASDYRDQIEQSIQRLRHGGRARQVLRELSNRGLLSRTEPKAQRLCPEYEPTAATRICLNHYCRQLPQRAGVKPALAGSQQMPSTDHPPATGPDAEGPSAGAETSITSSGNLRKDAAQ